jgi:hypothetical protein
MTRFAWRRVRETRWEAKTERGGITFVIAVSRRKMASQMYAHDIVWPDGRTLRCDTLDDAQRIAEEQFPHWRPLP